MHWQKVLTIFMGVALAGVLVGIGVLIWAIAKKKAEPFDPAYVRERDGLRLACVREQRAQATEARMQAGATEARMQAGAIEARMHRCV